MSQTSLTKTDEIMTILHHQPHVDDAHTIISDVYLLIGSMSTTCTLESLWPHLLRPAASYMHLFEVDIQDKHNYTFTISNIQYSLY